MTVTLTFTLKCVIALHRRMSQTLWTILGVGRIIGLVVVVPVAVLTVDVVLVLPVDVTVTDGFNVVAAETEEDFTVEVAVLPLVVVVAETVVLVVVAAVVVIVDMKIVVSLFATSAQDLQQLKTRSSGHCEPGGSERMNTVQLLRSPQGQLLLASSRTDSHAMGQATAWTSVL